MKNKKKKAEHIVLFKKKKKKCDNCDLRTIKVNFFTHLDHIQKNMLSRR